MVCNCSNCTNPSMSRAYQIENFCIQQTDFQLYHRENLVIGKYRIVNSDDDQECYEEISLSYDNAPLTQPISRPFHTSLKSESRMSFE